MVNKYPSWDNLLCGPSLFAAISMAASKASFVASSVLRKSLIFLNLVTPPALLTTPEKGNILKKNQNFVAIMIPKKILHIR